MECREALAFPGDPDGVVLLRRVIGCRGTAACGCCCRRAPHSAATARATPRHDGVWSGRSGPAALARAGRLRRGAVKAAHGRGELLMCEITVNGGGQHDFVLELSERALPDQPPDPDIAWDATEAAWSPSYPH